MFDWRGKNHADYRPCRFSADGKEIVMENIFLKYKGLFLLLEEIDYTGT